MVDQRLVDYIKKEFYKGEPEEQIIAKLRNAGWSEIDIDDAIISAHTTSKKIPNFLIIGIIIAVILSLVGVVTFFIFSFDKEIIIEGDLEGATKQAGIIENEKTGKEIEGTKQCKLNSILTKLELLEGVSSSTYVSDFQGTEEEISWISLDRNIADVNPTIGSSVMIKAKSKGTTKIEIIDNSVGPNCKISLPIEVTNAYS